MRAVLAALAITKDGKIVLRGEESSRPSILKEAQLKTLNSIARKMNVKSIIIPDFY
jgi:hypothetical protein